MSIATLRTETQRPSQRLQRPPCPATSHTPGSNYSPWCLCSYQFQSGRYPVETFVIRSKESMQGHTYTTLVSWVWATRPWEMREPRRCGLYRDGPEEHIHLGLSEPGRQVVQGGSHGSFLAAHRKSQTYISLSADPTR